MWLKRLRLTPNNMWMIPRITDIFILKELRKVSLLVAMFQIYHSPRRQKALQTVLKWKNIYLLLKKFFFFIVEILNIHTSRENNITNSYVPMA